jgi:hypothetical protein
MEVPTNPTRPSQFVWIFGSFFISANEIRVSREGLFYRGTETHGVLTATKQPKRMESEDPEETIYVSAGKVETILLAAVTWAPVERLSKMGNPFHST